MRNLIFTMLRNRKGQGLVEYGLIIALIALAVTIALTTLGGNISALFTEIAGELD